jgi:hypothetical protein
MEERVASFRPAQDRAPSLGEETMIQLPRGGYLGLFALVFGATGLAQAADAPPVMPESIQAVSYEGLGKVVKQYRGKILVVDFWNIT